MTQAPGPRIDGSFGCVAAAWAAHEAELRVFLRHRLPEPQAADDLLQDVFLKALRQGRRFCELDQPRAWLFQVARNALVDRARVAKVQVPLEEAEPALRAEPPAGVAPVDALAGCLLRVLDELAPEDAAILRACDLEGQTQRAFAERHGLSLPAAKSRLLRARRRLRERLTCACQVRFDADGSVSGHVPRGAAAPGPGRSDPGPGAA